MGSRMRTREFLAMPPGAFGMSGYRVDGLPEGPIQPAHDPTPPNLPPPPLPPLPVGPILQRMYGLRGAADVNPHCTSNQVFDDHIPGDYWTGYGSQDSERRTYSANWVNNVPQIKGRHVQGLNGCGCKSCSAAAGTMPGSAQRGGTAAVNA